MKCLHGIILLIVRPFKLKKSLKYIMIFLSINSDYNKKQGLFLQLKENKTKVLYVFEKITITNMVPDLK